VAIEVCGQPRNNEYKNETLYETKAQRKHGSDWKTDKYLHKTKKECLNFIKQITKDLIEEHRKRDANHLLDNYNTALKTVEENGLILRRLNLIK
jgi:hypothetical protein